MTLLRTIPAVLSLCLWTHVSHAQDAMEERISNSVKRIVAVQFTNGETAAIESIQTCYRTSPTGDVIQKVEDCVAQDIAYANLSAGMYRNQLKTLTQPQYATTDAMKVRVFDAAKSAGLSERDSEMFLRVVASIALKSLTPAIQSLRRHGDL